MNCSLLTRGLMGLLAALGVALVAETGCKTTGVGDPCIPEQEYNQQFSGFDEKEVNIESKSFQCQTRLCLVNHFRGRVSCTYGQDKDGNPPTAANGAPQPKACSVPGTNDPSDPKAAITGNPADPKGKTVKPQCNDRTADKAVYCSCRCANVNGKTDDGANYCTCPDGYDCEQLVTSIGVANEGLTGAYCVKHNTKYVTGGSCQQSCEPGVNNCP